MLIDPVILYHIRKFEEGLFPNKCKKVRVLASAGIKIER